MNPRNGASTTKSDMLIRNATLATMAGGHYNLIPGGAIAIGGDRILWAGPEHELPPGHAETIIDAEGGLVTPGLIDCHTHIVYGGNRAREFGDRLQGVTYEEIARRGGGILSTVRATRVRTARELAESARPRVLNLLHEGVTTLEAKTGYGLDLASELKMVDAMDILARELPVEIAKTFLGAHALPPEFAGHADAYVDLVCDEMIPAMAQRVEAVDVFCESIGFTLAQTRRIFESARRYGLAIKVHAEQLSYLGSAGLAADMGAVSADHLEHLAAADVTRMAVAGTVAVLLPCALYYLREMRRPPVDLFRAEGVPMAVATDANPGTAPCFSLLTAANMACVMLGLTPEEALAGITVHAARALGRADRLGTIEAGKQADLVLWDVPSPDELVYYLGLNPGATVIKRGKVITFE